MIRGSTLGALALALFLGACQTLDTPMPETTAMDGAWMSADGVFVATFERGNFTSRFTKTNEILAQGTYTVSGSTVSIQWMSVATQQQRSATCSITAVDSVTCNQNGGGRFDLKRSA